MINLATGIGGKGGRGMLRGPRRSLSQMTDGIKDEENNRPTKKTKTAPRSFSASPPPSDITKHYDDDDNNDDEGPQNPKGHPTVSAAFASKFTKSNAKQFDANFGKN